MSIFLFFVRISLSISIAAAKASSSTYHGITVEIIAVTLNGRLAHAFSKYLTTALPFVQAIGHMICFDICRLFDALNLT